MASLFAFNLLIIITSISAIQQQLTFFSKKDKRGESVTFRTNVRNLEDFLDSVITLNGSFEVVGWWTCMSEKNYTGEEGPSFSEELSSGNNDKVEDWVTFLSCRHHGALDTESIGLSLYSETYFFGLEQFVTGPFLVTSPVASYTTTGKSNWTFYEDINFRLEPRCVYSTKQVDEKDNVTDPIKFILPGCHV